MHDRLNTTKIKERQPSLDVSVDTHHQLTKYPNKLYIHKPYVHTLIKCPAQKFKSSKAENDLAIARASRNSQKAGNINEDIEREDHRRMVELQREEDRQAEEEVF